MISTKNWLIFYLFIANNSSLYRAFTNFTLKSSIATYNGNTFNNLFGFNYLSDGSKYYVLDQAASNIYIFDNAFNFLSVISVTSATNMLNINNVLYITSWGAVIYKTDTNINIQSQISSLSGQMAGILYSTNGFIYVAGKGANMIYVLTTSLVLYDSFSTSTYTPFSISEYNNQFYVGTLVGVVLVFLNKLIIDSFNVCNGASTIGNLVL